MSGRALIVLIVAMCLAGCGVPNRDDEAVRGDRWTSCAEELARDRAEKRADAMRLPLIGKDTTAVAVAVCAEEVRDIPGGLERVETEHRADDLAALLTALRLPDERRRSGVSCGDDVVAVPWLALFDRDGSWVRPGVAQDVCRKPRTEVIVAIHELRATLVRSRVRGGGEERSCFHWHPDPVWTLGEPAPMVSGVDHVDLEFPPDPLRCLYTVSPAGQRTGPPLGSVERGRGGRDDRHRVTALLRAHGPAPTCTTAAARFARLHSPARPGRDVYVELDGCTRILAMVLPGPPGPLVAPRLVVVGIAGEQLRSYLDRAS
jgi:hypothetical protein